MDLNISKILKEGGVGVLPTDTLYGIVGSALKPKTVERIYTLRKRNPQKPMIILISSIKDLNYFNVHPKVIDSERGALRPQTRRGGSLKFLKNIWPNPVSIILPCPEEKFKYLHRGTNSLAFRIPRKKDLLEILKQVGPLVAPSANIEGEKPAETIKEARQYFGDQVDFYLDQGKLFGEPSTLIKVTDSEIDVIREGSYNISDLYGYFDVRGRK